VALWPEPAVTALNLSPFAEASVPDSRVRAVIVTLAALAVLLAMWPVQWARAVPPSPPSPTTHRGGGWRAPLSGRLTVTRPFVPPLSPFGPGHRGVDLAALPGTAIRSAGTGTVRFAAPLAGRGVVVVGSGEIRTTYEPVRASVRVGQRVRAGDVIALLDPGHLGCPAAACLHWGALRGRVYLDPLTLLRAEHPRLLPYLVEGSPLPTTPAAAGQARAVTPPASTPGLAIGVGASAAVGTGLSLLAAWRRRP
jgi:murein DD-endopeptidase MepM/ murein hydrolase activator NlpD